jgi:hypothetical protein
MRKEPPGSWTPRFLAHGELMVMQFVYGRVQRTLLEPLLAFEYVCHRHAVESTWDVDVEGVQEWEEAVIIGPIEHDQLAVEQPDAAFLRPVADDFDALVLADTGVVTRRVPVADAARIVTQPACRCRRS